MTAPQPVERVARAEYRAFIEKLNRATDRECDEACARLRKRRAALQAAGEQDE